MAGCVYMQVKRVAGASGRMRKNEEGEWEWSDDDGECADDAQPKPPPPPPVSHPTQYTPAANFIFIYLLLFITQW